MDSCMSTYVDMDYILEYMDKGILRIVELYELMPLLAHSLIDCSKVEPKGYNGFVRLGLFLVKYKDFNTCIELYFITAL